MANRIQIRHGSNTPDTSKLLPYELGWDGDSLYIHNGKLSPNDRVICIAGANVSIPVSNITGILGVANGGTGVSSFPADSIIMSGSTSSGSTSTSELTTRAITNNITTTPITDTNGTYIPTINTIYYGLATINGNSQQRSLGIYAPTSAGSANQVLISRGNNNAPDWSSSLSLSGSITSGGCAVIRDSSTTARKIYTYTTQPTQQEIDAMSDGDLVLIKVS